MSEGLDAALAAIPYARWLGVRVEAGSDGAVAVLPFAAHLVGNPVLPALHGGVIGAFLEIAAVAHLAAIHTPGRLPRPIGVTVDYLRSGRPLDTFARAEVRRLGRRVAHVRAEAWQTDRDSPIAALHGNFLIPAAGDDEDAGS